MFSAINALFSGAAFVGVLFIIFLQRKALRLQKEELRLMRIDLQRTAKAQEKTEREFLELIYNSLLAAKLNSLSTLLQVQKEKINVESLKSLYHSNGLIKPIDKLSEPMEGYI